MKRLIILLVAAVMWLPHVGAQNIAVTSFAPVPTDLTANLEGTRVLDQNGEPCALIRIQTTQKGFSFEVGVLGVQKVDDSKVAEIWVYVPAGIRHLTIRHPQLGTLDDYEIPCNIIAGSVYKVKLDVAKVHTIVDQDDGRTYFTLSVEPANATVSIDGDLQTLDSDGMLSLYMKRGEHSFTIQCAGYASISETFTLGRERLDIDRRMERVMAHLIVTSTTPFAQIYVNDVLRGTDKWEGDLSPGDYLVEARLDGYYSKKQDIALAARETKRLVMPTLTGRYGKLNVGYQPLGSEVWLDGDKLGNSPDVFSDILIGTHEVEIRMQGYSSEKLDVTIEEGEIFAVTGSLAEAQPGVYGGGSESGSGQSGNGSPAETFTVNGVEFTMIRVDGGTFQMGATPDQGSGAGSNEKPVHTVTLSGYYIGQTEVTQALWTAVMGSNPSGFKGDNLPVDQVSYDDCKAFITRLNAATGKRFRLPTEAEWEYAARGGNKGSGCKYSGSNVAGTVAWYFDNSGWKTHEVAAKQANELGICDMSGNVLEWCSDRYGSYSSASQTNPVGPASGSHRVLRGGSWNYNSAYCLVSLRYSMSPDTRSPYTGLRLALSE